MEHNRDASHDRDPVEPDASAPSAPAEPSNADRSNPEIVESSISSVPSTGTSPSAPAPDEPLPISRSERVAQIRDALRTGNYPVDLDTLAEKIMERELLAPVKSDPSDDNKD